MRFQLTKKKSTLNDSRRLSQHSRLHENFAARLHFPRGGNKGGSPAVRLVETQAMDSKTSIPLGNVVRFPSHERRQATAAASLARDNWDHGPSPEESLRIMRAFVGIKDRQLRANLIEMLEGASRTRGPAPGPRKE